MVYGITMVSQSDEEPTMFSHWCNSLNCSRACQMKIKGIPIHIALLSQRWQISGISGMPSAYHN